MIIVGAGAAGRMAAITAARSNPGARVVCHHGARKPGAKILVSGGGRCNVTNVRVSADDFHGSSRPAIRKVLGRFPVERTRAFFAELGVDLVEEAHGKLFPSDGRARSVLQALLGAAADAGVTLVFPRRVESIQRAADGANVRVAGPWGALEAPRCVLASGGRSLPRTGSDGSGYALARACGLDVTDRVFPALAPLVTDPACFVTALAGIAAEVGLELRGATGKRLARVAGSMLCTHFGISGPAALDVSRLWIHAHEDDPEVELMVDWLPQTPASDLEQALLAAGQRSIGRYLREHLSERLAVALCAEAAVDPSTACDQLRRESRRALIRVVKECPLPVHGHRGWNHAEVTAGGVPLRQLDLATMEARAFPGLHLCGEVCDVDGRLGGFNFQWAWASGFVAGGGR